MATLIFIAVFAGVVWFVSELAILVGEGIEKRRKEK